MDSRFDIRGEKHAARVVDEFLAAPKLLTGEPSWTWHENSDDYRLTFVVTVDGIPTDATLEFIACPILQEQNFYPFTITLNFPPCIVRLEYVPSFEGHTNPIKEFADYDPTVYGSHYHAWEDSRYLAKPNELPRELEVAKALPHEIKTFEQAMRWFCDRTNIVSEKHQYIELPPRSWLL